MNPVTFWTTRPRRVRRPTSLDELHLRARTAVAKLTDSTSLASPSLVVADIPVGAARHAVAGHFRLVSADTPALGHRLPGFRRRLFLLRLALGKRYRLWPITNAPPPAPAPSGPFVQQRTAAI